MATEEEATSKVGRMLDDSFKEGTNDSDKNSN
jgi:hypothetical protein